jgi:hypothetical protein
MRCKKLSRSDRQFWKDHGIDPGVPSNNSMTTDQLGDAMLRTVRAMDADQKAHLRAKMNRSVSIAPKSSNGKPS